MNKLLGQSKLFLSRNASTILTCIGGVGVIATAVLTAKATPKALELIEQAKEEKGEDLTKLETVNVAGPIYIPAVMVGVSTIACIFGANVLNKRKQAAIMSAYALLDNSYKEYRKKVVELYGEDADDNVRKELVVEKYTGNEVEGEMKLFYDEFSERYFESTMERVVRAEYEINKKLSNWGGARLNEFYELLDIPGTDYGAEVGWNGEYLMQSKWNKWLDFEHTTVLIDDDLECVIISYSAEPVFDYEYY